MSIAEILAVTFSFFAGIALGTAFFGGLWWTISHSTRIKRPALLFVTSFFLRVTFAISVLYAVGYAHVERLSVCLLGFFTARFFILRLTRSPAERDGRT